jgi:hypothetical protein
LNFCDFRLYLRLQDAGAFLHILGASEHTFELLPLSATAAFNCVNRTLVRF